MVSKMVELTHDLLTYTNYIFRQNFIKIPMMGLIEALIFICVVIENDTWSYATAIQFMKVFLVLLTLALHL